ncbi:hypothetical protein [Kitasatospora sp. Root107]|uniref:hypothetical protein n=1 Tax=Kitasatospora sp. Root107 TaxID=1736424 RepID=UPI000A5FD5AB|nr:hypothetical protein [Kitasatospora sp. Root107]
MSINAQPPVFDQQAPQHATTPGPRGTENRTCGSPLGASVGELAKARDAVQELGLI